LNLRHLIQLLRRCVATKHTPDWVVLLLGLSVTWPLWVVYRPPIQDLPQHVAAVRVLSSYWDQGFRFSEYFLLTLGRTQYLTVYLLAVPFAKLWGPVVATKLILSFSLVTTPYCLLRLLRALGESPWLTLLSLPLVFNVHVAFGFLNFIAAIPILFLGLELAIKEQANPDTKRRWLLAVVLLFAFYTHIVPFGILVFGVVLLTRFERRAIVRQGLCLLPSLFVAAVWLMTSPAGRVVAAMGNTRLSEDTPPSYQSFSDALRTMPEWLLDITPGDNDEMRLVVWLVVVVFLLVLAATNSAASDVDESAVTLEGRALPGRVVVGLIVPLSLVAYVMLPTANGFIWPICQRFPLIAAFFVVPLLERAEKHARNLAGGICIALSCSAAIEYQALFRQSEATAYRGFDAVIAEIPKGSRVATLVFDRHVEGLRLSPLMHAAGWVQAERGGMVMFTFAEFPSSPFTYREIHRPPKVPPRWEWVPERVKPDRELSWYDFVLVHGWTGSLEASSGFRRVIEQGRWSLWRRVDSASSESRDVVRN
jgi:hypothetical protein